ncbi:MAG: TetR/AcrR family transcriptional regulator [Oceanospirillaceae bacterium]|nr:TetR/AcrR family transcriptional regulator [Oceanospirillaceae bacterium]
MARKKNFDPEHVLQLAVNIFWEKGYADTSLTDLTTHLGINKFSLYSTFGDKKTLYLKALAYYIDNQSIPALARLNEPDAGLIELEIYINNFIELQSHQTSGCFVQNAILELSLSDEKVRTEGSRLYSYILDSFQKVLTNAQRQGQIRNKEDVEVISHFLLLQLQGIRVLGKAKQYAVIRSSALVIFEYLSKLRY